MKRTNTTSGEGEDSELQGPGASNAVLLQVYLWTGVAAPNAASAAEVPPPAFAMAADLLQVRGGELREAPAGSIAASFPDAVLAVNAARNVQRLVQGFSRAWQGGTLGGCTVLTRADEAAGGVDVGSLRDNQALKQAHPGQVVFAGSLCNAARTIPGLEFRAITGIASGTAGKNGTALQLLPPTRMKGFVEEPFEPRVAVDARPEVAARPEAVVTPRPPAYVLVASAPTEKSAAVPVVMPSSGQVTDVPIGATRAAHVPAATDEIGSFSREEKPSGKGMSRWVVLGGVAAAVIAGILMFTPVLRRSPHPAPAPLQQQAAPASPVPASAPTPVPASSAAPRPAPPTKTKANDAAHAKPAAHAANQADSVPMEDPHVSHGLMFTPAEINSLIAHADKDSGNGNFDKAIQEYRLVLSREPSNDLAKRGLARALYNKGHQ